MAEKLRFLKDRPTTKCRPDPWKSGMYEDTTVEKLLVNLERIRESYRRSGIPHPCET